MLNYFLRNTTTTAIITKMMIKAAIAM